ncbi:SDR family oxidoreductase [Nonomuraea recticatena]|uniref:SDR family oxidoreductase n=1 Tax=Nonomuraea recticatena TaxID=46178 RepID=A0ABN3T6L9_9ACTN
MVVADVAAGQNDKTAQMIHEEGGNALAVTCDVTSDHDVRAALDALVGEFGRLDVAFNNAGVEQPVKPLTDIPEDEWDRVGRFTGGTPEGRQGVIDQEPVGRMGTPEEIASAVLWLCSPPAAFTIGHALVVDGGQTV